MILKSHLYSLIIFAFIVSTLIGFIRFDEKKAIFRYSLKLFLYMTCGVIAFSWFMRFL